MSATLDSALFAKYFGDCPVLAAGGRTFPVEHCFLEDAYQLTGRAPPPCCHTAVAKSQCHGLSEMQQFHGRQGPCMEKTPWRKSVVCV